MTHPTYASAQLAADRILRYFATQSVLPRFSAEHAATLPDSAALAALIDAAFWTSLRREEGYIPRVSLAFVAREQVDDGLTFATSLCPWPRILPNSLQPSRGLAFIWVFGHSAANCAFGGLLATSPHSVWFWKSYFLVCWW